MPESGRFIHKMLSVTVMHVGQSLEASRQTFSDFALALEAVRRGARRNASRPAHGHQMHELGSIDVMRLDQTLGQSRCLRIKLYVDENFP